MKHPRPFCVFAFAFFCVVPLPPRLPATSFGTVAPINLRPMTAAGVLPGGVLIALVFTATAASVASTFVGGGVGIRNIAALLGEIWV